MTFEFGAPHLHIREPKYVSVQTPMKVREFLAKRTVSIYGEWHLWVYLCDWQILSWGKVIANSESKGKKIKKAISELDGQALVQVTINPDYSCRFEFDLGGRLETLPNSEAYEKDAEQWLLYEPSGDVFTLRSDGKYSRMPGNANPDTEKFEMILKG
ncbi:MAG: hypothetical protein SD837_01370 [Candidatus Electrothrix scaldis]|nr:MAG: hypothetical protein SD837_01370 [Candidatus Electrothrix sp. GW3-3]